MQGSLIIRVKQFLRFLPIAQMPVNHGGFQLSRMTAYNVKPRVFVPVSQNGLTV